MLDDFGGWQDTQGRTDRIYGDDTWLHLIEVLKIDNGKKHSSFLMQACFRQGKGCEKRAGYSHVMKIGKTPDRPIISPNLF